MAADEVLSKPVPVAAQRKGGRKGGRPENTAKLTEEQRRLVESNMRLVGFWLNRMQRSIPRNLYEDCRAAGYLGLVKAAQTFDESKGFQFSTLAGRCIMRRIIRLVREEYNRNMSGSRDSFCGRSTISLNDFMTDLHKKRDIGDFLAAPEDEQADPDFVADFARKLPAGRMREVFVLYFGEGKSAPEIAKMMGVSRERVAQYYRSAAARYAFSLGLSERDRLPAKIKTWMQQERGRTERAEDLEALERMIRDQKTDEQIIEATGYKLNYVRMVRARVRQRKIHEMLGQGYQDREVAEATGLSHDRIRKLRYKFTKKERAK